MQRWIALILAAFLVFGTAACGKKAPPRAPSDDSTFPRQYPSS